MKRTVLAIVTALLILTGCHDKLDLTEFEDQKGTTGTIGDTVYIKLSPDWTGFNKPHSILIGNDVFAYVTDTDNDRIVMLDLNGEIIGTRTVKRPTAIAQDYQLNLLVCAEKDTVLNGTLNTISVVYKIDMVEGLHDISTAPMSIVLPRPDAAITQQDLRVTYTGVTAFFDNTFHVSRTGPNNNTLVSPDNSILMFFKKELPDGTKADTLVGRIPMLDPMGTGLMSATYVSSMVSFSRRNVDFIMTMTGDNNFKVQWLTFVVSDLGSAYQNKLAAEGSDLMSAGTFEMPVGITLDNVGNIFVIDAAKDSLFKFNSFGDEMESFGGPDIFANPHGVAHHNQVLYIADTDNNRIKRFQLSTDLE